MREHLVLEGGGQGRVVHHGDLEQLEERGLRDIPALGDGRRALADEEARPDIGLELPADERLLRVVGAEAGHQVDLSAESRHVVCAGEGSARMTLEPDVPRGDDGVLGCLAQGHAVAVLVDDRLADDEDLERPERGQRVAHHAGGVPRPEALEEASRSGIARRVPVRSPFTPVRSPGKRKCAFSKAVEEKSASCVKRTSPPSARPPRSPAEPDAAPSGLLAGLALDVVVRPEQADRFHRRGRG